MDRTKAIERRSGKDRRRRPTPPLSKYTFFGARRSHRRADDQDRDYYVDRYSKRAVWAILLLLGMCVADSYITIYLVGKGGQEINPLMNFALNISRNYFLLVKYLMTGICLVILLMHKNFYIFKGKISVKHTIVGFIVLYGFLILYEIGLLVQAGRSP